MLLVIGSTSSQAKGTKSTSFLTHVRNEVDLVPLACEDEGNSADQKDAASLYIYVLHCLLTGLCPIFGSNVFLCLNPRHCFAYLSD